MIYNTSCVLLIAAFVIAIALGAMAFGFILRGIGDLDWEMVGRVGKGPIRGFFLILPYIWLAVLGIVLYLCRVKYSHRPKQVIVIDLTHSFIISWDLVNPRSILYFAGAAHSVENELADRVKPYADWMEKNEKTLVAPDEGVLVGIVIDNKKR